MRIGLFIDTFNLGGAETMLLDIAGLLKASGHTPILLHFGNPYLNEYAAKHGLENYVVPNHKAYKKTLTLPIFAFKTISFLKKLQLDCLHTHLFGSITGMAVPAKLAGIRHVGTLHDVYTIEEAPKRINLLKMAVAFGTKLIAVSSPMRNFYQARGNFKPESLTFVANFVPAYAHSGDRAEVRAELGVNEQDFVIFSVGRLVSLKRFDLIIDAAKICKQTHSDKNIKIFIAGGGELEQPLKQQIAQTQTQGVVTLLGERNDIPKLLSAADTFVLASDTEGMSRSILEAMAAELPIIATDVGGNSDLVVPDQNGYLVPPNNASALAEKFGFLAGEQEICNKFSTCSKQFAISKFGAEQFLAQHLANYQGK
ncbi:glycosyltransferase [Saccharophagus degradans]|uniref:Glycosyltransferase n=1 Tax=Saccharophagus degradans TaxID=86304 RepID=A0AAW7XB16_9GAMM|nr:glycosyltransferase [Saccharophagus degradans]MDO6424862.1 glycosyltransferase [Saccharophagus degradans]MDO6606650.1 glycosyltransferase [Saccharophagus degradans]